jgi:hypothetical protein
MRRHAFLTKAFSPLTWSFVTMTIAALVGGFVIYSAQRVQRSQDLGSDASSAQSKIELSFRADKTSLPHDQTVSVDVLLNTGSQSISAVSLLGLIQGKATDVVVSSTSQGGITTAFKDQTKTGDNTNWQVITFANPTIRSLYSTHGQTVKLTTLVINPSSKGTITLTVNSGSSKVTGQSTGTTIQYPSALTITVNDPGPNDGSDKKSCNGNCATDTECKSEFICHEGRCRLPDKRTDDKCGATPDNGLQRTCNEYCADTRECAAGFTCYYNRCRNPRNIDNQQCQNPPSPRPITSVRTPVGTGSAKGGTRALPSPTIVTIKSSPLPSVSSIILNGSGSGRQSSPSPSPSALPSPSTSASPSVSPSPTPTQAPQAEKKGANVFLIALLVTLLVGGIAGLAYVLIKYRG